MSLTINEAKEILGNLTCTDAELQVVLDASEELVDLFLEELINSNYEAHR